ncbi:hypothetical protein OURE66S_00227 [Oligella ureolytica]
MYQSTGMMSDEQAGRVPERFCAVQLKLRWVQRPSSPSSCFTDEARLADGGSQLWYHLMDLGIVVNF